MKKILLIALLLAGWPQYAQQINRIEYWIDGDPGYGLATPVAMTPAVNLQNVIINDVLSLIPGMHTLGIRSKDSDGRWSQTNMIPFMITQTMLQSDIVLIEYFWDGDAGFGQNQIYPLTSAAQDLANHIFQATVPAGFSQTAPHILFSRTMDSFGRYSQTNIVDEVTLSTESFTHSGIRIYPNPVENELNINLADSGRSRLIIHDIQGKLMLDTVVEATAKIDIGSFATGIYTAYFWKEQNQIYVVKLIKE